MKKGMLWDVKIIEINFAVLEFKHTVKNEKMNKKIRKNGIIGKLITSVPTYSGRLGRWSPDTFMKIKKIITFASVIFFMVILSNPLSAAVTIVDSNITTDGLDEIDCTGGYTNGISSYWYVQNNDVDDITIFFQQLDVEENYDFVDLYAWDYSSSEWVLVRKYTGGPTYNFWTGYLGSNYIKIHFHSDLSVTKDGFKIRSYAAYDTDSPSCASPQRVHVQLWVNFFKIGPNDYDGWGADEHHFQVFYRKNAWGSRWGTETPQKYFPGGTANDQYYATAPGATGGNDSTLTDGVLTTYGNANYEKASFTDEDTDPEGAVSWNEMTDIDLTYMSNDSLCIDIYGEESGAGLDGTDELANVRRIFSCASDFTGWYYVQGDVEAGANSKDPASNDYDVGIFLEWHDVAPPPPVATISTPTANDMGWANTNTITFTPVSDISSIKRYEYRAGETVGDWTSIGTNTTFAAPDGNYNLYVRGMDNHNCSHGVSGYTNGNAVADTYIAVKIDITAPPKPTLQSPDNAVWINTNNPVFDWTDETDTTSGIRGYHIEISTLSDCSVVLKDSQTVTSQYSEVTLSESPNPYYWRVRSRDNADNYSLFTTTFSIYVDTTPPTLPTYNSPADNSWINSTHFTFQWNSTSDPLSGLAGYLFEISTISASDFSTIYYSSETTNVNFSTGPFTETKQYYWRVRAKDNAGNYSVGWSTWTVGFDFTAPTPNPPTGSANADSTTQITWTATVASDSGGSGLDSSPYSFDNGGTWQVSNTFVKSDCAPNTQYTKTIKYRDAAGNQTSGTCISKYTLPAAPTNDNVTCDKATGTVYTTSLFTFSTTFGAGTFEYIKYKWDTSPTESNFPDTWSGGVLSKNALTQNTSYYLHIKTYNGDDEANATTLTKGPYLYQSNYNSATDTTDSDFGAGLVKSSVNVVGSGNPAFIEVKIQNSNANSQTWLTGWKYRRKITINSTNSSTLTDFQVLITINTQELISAGKMQSNGEDIRFTTDTGTEISYWIESGINTTSTKIWVNVPSIAANGNTDIWMYYGSPSASSVSNGNNTFEWFNDYGGTEYGEGSTIASGVPLGDNTRVRAKVSYGSSSDGIFVVIPYTNKQLIIHLSTNGGDDVQTYDGSYHTIASLTDSDYPIVAEAIIYDSISAKRTVEGYEAESYTGGYYSDTGIDNTITIGTSGTYTWTTKVWFVSVCKYASPEPTVSSVGSEEGPYYSSGEFQSRVIDTTEVGTVWGQISWGENTPNGTNIKLKTRTGDTATPDGTWSSWYPVDGWYEVAAGTPIGSPRARYIQYLSSFTTTVSTQTPQLLEVNIQFATNTATAPNLISPADGTWTNDNTPTLDWDFVDNELDTQIAYQIELSTDINFGVINYSTGPYNSTVSSMTWQEEISNGIYWWRVKTQDNYGKWSVWSSTYQIKIDTTPPSGHSISSVVAHISSCTISWATATDGGSGLHTTSYAIRYSTSSGFEVLVTTVSAWMAETSTQTLTLSPNVTYYFQVKARDALGNESWSATFTKATLCSAPGSPTWETVYISSITVSWGESENPANPDDTVYIAQVSTASDFSGVILSSSVKREAGNAVVSGLLANTTYYGRVIAENWENIRTTTTITSPKATLCSAPDSPAWGTVYASSITVKWGESESPVNPDGTIYVAQLSTASDFSGVILSSSAKREAGSAVVSGLTPNYGYYYGRVVARNREGHDAISNLTESRWTKIESPTGIKFDLLGITSVTISGVTATGENDQAFTNLGDDLDSQVYFRIVGSGIDIQTWKYNNTWTKTGLLANTTYSFYCKATNAEAVETALYGPEVKATRIENVASVSYVIGSSSIGVVAAASGGSFSNLSKGQSGIYYAVCTDTYSFGDVSKSTWVWVKMNDFIWFSHLADGTTLQANTTYYVISNSRNYDGLCNSTTSVEGVCTLADVPGGLMVSPKSDGGESRIVYSLNSDGNDNATEYLIAVSTDNWGSMRYLGKVGDNPAVVVENEVWKAKGEWETGYQWVEGLSGNTTYWFKVKARNRAGVETIWSGVTSTVTYANVPYNVEIDSHNIITWDGDGSYYYVECSTASDFSVIESTSGWISESSWAITGLDMNKKHYVRVKAKNRAGQETGWSSTRVVIIDTTKPQIPQPVNPADGEYLNTSTVLLKWNVSDTGTGVEFSTVQVSGSSDFSDIIASTFTKITQFQVQGLSSGRFWWKVACTDYAGNFSGWSSTFTFFVDLSTPPAPLPISPDGTWINDTTLELIWQTVIDTGSGVNYYEVNISTKSGFSPIYFSTQVVSSSTTVGNLSVETTYYWEARVVDIAGNISNWSGYKTFFMDITAPETPSPITPSDNAFLNFSSPTLKWAGCSDRGEFTSGIENYEVRLSTDSNFSAIIYSSITEFCNLAISRLADGQYFWQVRSIDTAGNFSSWFSTKIFTIDTLPLLVSSFTISGFWVDNENLYAGAGSTETIRLNFDDILNESSVVNNIQIIKIIDKNNNDTYEIKESTISVIGNIVELSPIGTLDSNCVYRIIIGTGIKDSAGNFLSQVSSRTFRTLFDHSVDNIVSRIDNRKVYVELNAFSAPEDGYIIIEKFDSFSQQLKGKIAQANQKVEVNKFTKILSDSIYSFKCFNSNNELITNFSQPVNVYIPYQQTNGYINDFGIIINPQTLLVCYLDENTTNWISLESEVLESQEIVRAETTHFTVFALKSSENFSLAGAHAYPVPWKPTDGITNTGTLAGGITFTGLSSRCSIEIYTITGEPVYKIWHVDTVGSEGKEVWEGTTSSDKKVASGVYIFYIKNEKEHKTGKLMIIR